MSREFFMIENEGFPLFANTELLPIRVRGLKGQYKITNLKNIYYLNKKVTGYAMEFIIKKLTSMSHGDRWAYSNEFFVEKTFEKWKIFKNYFFELQSSDVKEIAKEIQLTFITIEINKEQNRLRSIE